MDEHHQPPQPPQTPYQPNRAPDPRRNPNEARDLKISQNLVMVASLAGPVSLFIGGVFLSGVGLVCAVIALRKINALANKIGGDDAAKRLKRSCIIALVICGIALVLNAVSAYLAYPMVLEALESGDYGNLAPGADLGSAPETPRGNSTWG